MKISVVTPTKDRPWCLELCKKYVDRQTYKVHEHIIVGGGGLYENMYEALSRVTGDAVVIFEDDDWYDKNWVAKCVENLGSVDLFGQGLFHYYHIPSSGYILKNVDHVHAPLHATSFKSSLISRILSLPKAFKNKKPLFDKVIWEMDEIKKKTICDKFVVSLKGLPGLKGYSSSHRKEYFKTFDTKRTIIKEWIGDDIILYTKYFQ